MSDVVQLAPSAVKHGDRMTAVEVPAFREGPAIRTDAVYVVFTTIDETLAALRVADALCKALAVPLTLIHFRVVPYPLPVDQPSGLSPVETDAFASRLLAGGFDMRVRIFLCRHERHAIPMAFKRHSLIVMGGHRRWRPMPADRWRRWLEKAGHFVVFVDTKDRALRKAVADA
jgi:hypothetical protein